MEKALVLRNVTKRYPGVVALDNVSVEFRKGEVSTGSGVLHRRRL